jgi:hypothetical protein
MKSSHRICRVVARTIADQRALLTLALLILLWAPEAPARADLIFSNFGPNHSYDPTDGWTAGAIDSSTVQDIAVLFRVGSHPVTLDEVDVAMGFTNKPNLINLKILLSVNGAPGPDSQPLESFPLVNALPPFGSGAPPVVIESVLHPLLEAKTSYWLVASAAQPTQVVWNANLLPYANSVAYRDNAGPWATLGVDAGPAFAVLGTPAPEPWTLGLLGIGAVGLVVFQSRQRLFGFVNCAHFSLCRAFDKERE